MHWLGRHRLLILAGICGFWTALVVTVRFAPGVPFFSTIWQGEQAFEDLLQREGRKTATHPDFVFLGIDQSTLQLPPLTPDEVANNRAFQLLTERRYPWSCEVWALLLDRLFGAGARLVMFDLLFNLPNDGDAAFHAALEKYRDRVVVGSNIDSANGNQLVVPNETLLPLATADARVGYVNFWPNAIDGKIRTARFTITDRQLAGLAPHPSEEVFQSLSARALEKLGRADAVPRDHRAHLIRFSAIDAYQPLPLYEVFDPKFWHANYADGSFFKGKVVVVGSSAPVQHDTVDTPLGPDTPGSVMHLHAMAAAMDREFLRNTPLSTDYALVCAAGLLAWGIIGFVRRPLFCILLLVAVSAAYVGAARLFYDRAGLFILAVPVLAAFLLSGAFSLGFQYALERLEKLRMRRTLERYVSKNLVKEILENPAAYYETLRGTRKETIILFSDIVDFTAKSERANSEALVQQLNQYLSRMVAVVFAHDGTLDKFIGDAVMAVWGNVHSHGIADDAKLAARAAVGMRRELRKLNEQWRAQGTEELRIGIGINQGEVLVGNIGSEEKMDFTVIGDAVNLASRLEGLTRTYQVDILLGPTLCDLLRDEFHLRSVGRVQVKGKTEPVEVCALVAARAEDVDPEFVRWLESYEEGILKFRARDFTQAKILFSRFLEFYPDDELAKMYLERALKYEQEPPDEAWNAVEVFTKK
jgi:adenylate cyclase